MSSRPGALASFPQLDEAPRAGRTCREPNRESVGSFCFAVQAAAEPGAMPRVLEFFAKRGLVPSRWFSRTQGPGERELWIDIQMSGLDRETGDYMARCLRQIPDVGTVLTSVKPA